MHAGAALHSWPNLEKGLSEIRRVLRPDGGRFFATTFLRGAYPGTTSATPGQSGGGGGSFRFFESEEELRQLLIAAGFPPDGVSVRRDGAGAGEASGKAALEAKIAQEEEEMIEELLDD